MTELLKDLSKSAEGNKYNSLSDKEKRALQDLNVADIQKQKDELGKTEFTVGGKAMTLSEIVKKFDTATNKVDGTKIAVKSDLAAAIQVYILACGGSISDNPHAYSNEAKGIDGVIGRDSKGGISFVKTKSETPGNGNDNADGDKDKNNEVADYLVNNIDRLVYCDFTDYVGGYSDPKYGLLITSGRDAGGLMRTRINGSKITIRYGSAIEQNLSQHIELDAEKYKVGNKYSVKKFGEAIKDAIDEKERKLQEAKDKKEADEKLNKEQKAIIANIEKVGVNAFSQKIQVYLREKGYVFGNGLDFQTGPGTGIKFASNGELDFGNAFSLGRAEIGKFYSNGVFNKNEFIKTLSKKVDAAANQYFKSKVNTAVSSLEKTTVTQDNLQSVKLKIKDIDDIIGLGVDVGEPNKQILERKRNEVKAIENQRENEKNTTAMHNAIKQGAESFDTTKFPKAIQDYLREKKYLSTFGNTMDFHTGIGTGIEFTESGNLKLGNFITIPKSIIETAYVNNKFDQNKFKTIIEIEISKEMSKELGNLLNRFGEININTLTREENKFNEAKKLNGKIESLGNSAQRIRLKLEKRAEEIKKWKEFKEVSMGVDKKITQMIDSLKTATGNSIFDKRNELANFHNALKSHTATYDEKNIYEVYTKVNNGDKYDNLITRVYNAIPQLVNLN